MSGSESDIRKNETIHDCITSPIDYEELHTIIIRALEYVRFSKPHDEDDTYIIRSIEFPPEYHQAGLGILNYFGTIVRQKYPSHAIGVRIEQEGLKVRMVIETPEGMKDQVEQTLDEYGLVVMGKMAPEAFMSDPLQVLQLQNKLELTQTELRMTQNVLQLTQKNYEGRMVSLELETRNLQRRVVSLESETRYLRGLLGTSLQHAPDERQMLQPLIDRLSDQHNEAFTLAFDTLKKVVDRGLTEMDKPAVTDALTTVRRYEPDVFDKFADFCRGASMGATGNLLAKWIPDIINRLPI